MDFLKPIEVPPIPTYHVMDSGGSIGDSSRGPPEVTDEQVLEWYKNMLTGKSNLIQARIK
jgi:2-oxoisovalerate dehydrogenase E1 component alpha subunit